MALALVAARLLRRPELIPLVMMAWCAVCAAVARLLFVPVLAIFKRRRENLALIRRPS